MAFGTMMLSGHGQHLNPEEVGVPSEILKIAILESRGQARL
jgi:hypothetical protein